ncbi:MAG TPA: class F sortase [Candidatus Dormibacteraeota bacterium]|nr:class F sortase [Candidatus Dormibacteraeota bacterium]
MKQSPWVRLLRAVSLAVMAAAALAIQVLAAPDGWLAVDGSIRSLGAPGTVDWANSGPAAAACANGGVNVAGSGGIFNCGRPGAAGAPPIAPVLTPSAAVDPSIISAVFLVDPVSGDTACGATGDPTTLSGINGDPINSYPVSQGPVPNKDDLANVYAVSHTRSDTGHPELYFAAERLLHNGDSHMDFEFLQSVVSYTPCSTGVGALGGHRTEGDLLVSVDYSNGGTVATPTVFQWHCAPLPAPQPPDGTVCDPGAGALYESIGLPPAVTLTVNAAPVPCGGWICRDTSGQIANVDSNDFLEGGIDLAGIPFSGCFNTFLPHTRTSGSPTAQLKDFAGPIGFRSCRDPVIATASSPTGSSVAPGLTATDTITVTNGGAGPTPTGSVTFFICGPTQVTASGCPAGGSQIGAAKPLTAGAATSDPTPANSAAGTYCWRTVYTPDATSTGVFTAATHSNSTSECFGVVAATLPNTGVPDSGSDPVVPLMPLMLVPLGLFAVASRRARVIVVLVVAWLATSASPIPADAIATPRGVTSWVAVPHDLYTPPTRTAALATEKARTASWRVVISRIGLDAPIEPVGRDSQGAMQSPSSLDTVGWFDSGPKPGQPGDAVLDGHFGLPAVPAVFRNLRALHPGDTIHVSWPDGRGADFRVSSTSTVPAGDQPPGLFASSGPARLSLITCAGAWDQSHRTYTERLIITAEII